MKLSRDSNHFPRGTIPKPNTSQCQDIIQPNYCIFAVYILWIFEDVYHGCSASLFCRQVGWNFDKLFNKYWTTLFTNYQGNIWYLLLTTYLGYVRKKAGGGETTRGVEWLVCCIQKGVSSSSKSEEEKKTATLFTLAFSPWFQRCRKSRLCRLSNWKGLWTQPI